MSRAVPSTACFAREVEDQGSGNLTLNHFPAERRSTNHRFGPDIGHDSSMRSSRLNGMRESPIHTYGLHCAAQWPPRAALDANDFWIRLVGAQHPVKSHGQLARRRHLGHCFRLLMAAMLILFAKLRIKTNGGLRGFDQQHPQQAIALFRDRSQVLPSARRMLARNQTQITRYL